MDMQALHLQFMRVTHRFHRMQMTELFSGISRGEFVALEVLRQNRMDNPEQQGMYVSGLAGRMRVSMPAASRMLKALEQKGWIERHVDKEDRRNTFIHLTAAGEGMVVRTKQQLQYFNERVFEKMGLEETRQLLALWERLIGIMEEEGIEQKHNKGDQECSE